MCESILVTSQWKAHDFGLCKQWFNFFEVCPKIFKFRLHRARSEKVDDRRTSYAARVVIASVCWPVRSFKFWPNDFLFSLKDSVVFILSSVRCKGIGINCCMNSRKILTIEELFKIGSFNTPVSTAYCY